MAMPTQMIGGLVSGLDTANIIEQLMSIERRPIENYENRILEHETTLEAYRGVNNLVLELSNSVSSIADDSLWEGKTTSSTNESILTATAGQYAAIGTHSFRVGRLAQTAQFLSSGFADRESAAVSPYSEGEIHIDSAKARVNRPTSVNVLNGGAGLYHGSIRITDKAGQSAVVDLSTAETVQDVLDAINATSGIDVVASVAAGDAGSGPEVFGDALTLTDTSGALGTLKVENYGGGSTADDLGWAGKTAAGASTAITGDSILHLSGQLSLTALRDGLGVNDGTPGTIILDKFGDGTTTVSVDLSEASTVQDVIDAINAEGAAEGISARIRDDGRGLTLESDDPTADLKVASDLGGGTNTTAEDLGLVASAGAGDTLVGHALLGDMNSAQIAALAGVNGTGLNGALGDDEATLGEIRVSDDGGGTWDTFDLGNLTGEDSLSDVVYRLNERARTLYGDGALVFRVNDVGNGIAVENGTAGTDFTFDDQVGTTATDLGLAGETLAAGESLNGGDLDRHYISRGTRLDTLNGGAGVSAGSILVTNASGAEQTISLAGAATVGDVIEAINGASAGVTASLNATGDGILLQDTTGGTGDLVVEEVDGGTTAADLGLLGVGVDVAGTQTLDGSFERVVTVDTNDTLTDVMNKLADTDSRLQASIIHDGSEYAPYRLVVTSQHSGAVGDVMLDSSLAALRFTQSSEGRDALLLYGQGGEGISPLMLRSSTNTNNSAVLGLSLEMKNASSEYVTVTVGRDTAKVAEQVSSLVEGYNNLHDLVGELDSYDEEESTGGILFGDSATRALVRTLDDLFFNTLDASNEGYKTLFDVGFGYTDEGELELDASVLAEALRSDFDAVKNLMIMDRDAAREGLNTVTRASVTPGAYTLYQLNGGTGVNEGLPGSILLDKYGDGSTVVAVDLSTATTVQNVIDLINAAGAAENITATLNGDNRGFAVGSADPGTDMKITSDGANNTTAEDLGLVHAVGAGETLQGKNVLTDVNNIINGNTNANDYGVANGFASSSAMDPAQGYAVTVDFNTPRNLTQVILHHINTNAMPADEYALRDFSVEYLDAATNQWETLRNVSSNVQEVTYLGFGQPTDVRALRITGYNSNAPDNRFRLLEVEAKESQGLLSRMDQALDEIVDSTSGFFATQQELISEKIEDLETNIEKLESRLEDVETGLLREYTAMETALAQMQSQADYFEQQMSAWTSGKK